MRDGDVFFVKKKRGESFRMRVQSQTWYTRESVSSLSLEPTCAEAGCSSWPLDKRPKAERSQRTHSGPSLRKRDPLLPSECVPTDPRCPRPLPPRELRDSSLWACSPRLLFGERDIEDPAPTAEEPREGYDDLARPTALQKKTF